MTREEAIKILKAIRVYECYPKSASEETKEALDMAIEALSNNITESPNEAIKRQNDAIDLVRCKDCKHRSNGGWCDVYIQPRMDTDFCNHGERQCNYFGERKKP